MTLNRIMGILFYADFSYWEVKGWRHLNIFNVVFFLVFFSESLTELKSSKIHTSNFKHYFTASTFKIRNIIYKQEVFQRNTFYFYSYLFLIESFLWHKRRHQIASWFRVQKQVVVAIVANFLKIFILYFHDSSQMKHSSNLARIKKTIIIFFNYEKSCSS